VRPLAVLALALLAAGCAASSPQPWVRVAAFEVQHTHCGPPVAIGLALANDGAATLRGVVATVTLEAERNGTLLRHTLRTEWGDLAPGENRTLSPQPTLDVPERCEGGRGPFIARLLVVDAAGRVLAQAQRELDF
jgi:hypothetical protein